MMKSSSEGQKGSWWKCPQGQEWGKRHLLRLPMTITISLKFWAPNGVFNFVFSVLYKMQKRRIIPCVSFLLPQIKCHKHLKTTRISCLIVSEGLVWAQLSWILACGLRGPRSRHGPCSGSPWSLGSSFRLIQCCCWIQLPVELKSLFSCEVSAGDYALLLEATLSPVT